ncbi:MAG: glycosyltransferase family 2 protein [Burkholderiales bacterium]
MSPRQITVSIVSHGQGALVSHLLDDLQSCCAPQITVILTANVPEQLAFAERPFSFPVVCVRNRRPKGFGANHNAAFTLCETPHFCVLNPDIRLGANPFPHLLEELGRSSVGVVSPRILSPAGAVEDNARYFPTLPYLLRKLLGLAPLLDYPVSDSPMSPDWVAGMFMIFRKEVFAEIRGFDERYFLYYEDVDLCRRLRARGYDVRLIPSAAAAHDARRESRRSLRHLHWHLRSMLRFLAAN